MNNTGEYMLTTYDNPFNPFEDFERWFKEDILLGHNCCGLLGKKALTSKVFSDEVNEKIIENAVNEIIQSDPLVYKKVTKEDYAVLV